LMKQSSIKIMKNLKSKFALVAVLLGVCLAFAFKAPAKSAHTTTEWFTYVGGDPDDPGSYMEFGPTQPTCGGTANLCAIQANDVSGSPDLTSALKADINNAITNHRNLSDVKLKP
jgi:hypothetical protein